MTALIERIFGTLAVPGGRNGPRWSGMLPAVLGILLLSGCAARSITLEGDYPTPLVQKLPVTVGVYYPEELRNFAYTEIDDTTGNDQYIINSGASQIELFNTILPALFNKVVMLDSLDAARDNKSLDAVFVPNIQEFQLGLPSKTKLKVYEIWLKYDMKLSKANGDYIADWVMTAYGKAPTDTFQSVDTGISEAANVAMRDLAASFTLGFANQPAVNEWLRGEQNKSGQKTR